MINNTQENNDHMVLKEILPLPSKEIITDRFSTSNESEIAGCSGRTFV
jgi:hypothetical protein